MYCLESLLIVERGIAVKTLIVGLGEPFSSPTWGSNVVVFSSADGQPIGEAGVQDYLRRVSAYARNNQVYLVPERFILTGHHCMCLIGPDGRVLQAQKALHLAPEHRHLERGKTIDLVQTEFGTIFLCVDVDIFYPEVVRIAANRGADYIITSGYLPEDVYTNHKIVAGPWNASQSNHVFVIAATNKYHCVTAPRIIKQYKQGFVVPPSLSMPMSAATKASVLEQLPVRPLLDSRVYLNHKEQLEQ